MKLLKYASVLFICVFAFGVSGHKAFAGSCSSVGGTSWNTGANWSAGCTGAGGIPGANDDVTIAVGHPITLDVATASLNSMHIYSTLDTSGSNFALNMNGTQGLLYIESGGVLNANGSTITIGGFLYDQLGTFNAGTSTVTFTLNGSTTIIYGSPTFYNLSFAPTLTGTGDYDLNGSTLTVNNNLTFNPTAGSSQVLNATMGNTITVAGAVSVGGSGSATTVFNTNGQTLSAGTLTITSAGTLTAGASTINITGTSGTLFTKSGTFTAGTSTVNFSGNGTATLVSGTTTFYNLTSSGTGTKSQGANITFATGGTLSVTNGTYNPPVAPGITANGSNTLSVTNATVNAVTAFEFDFPFATKTLGTGSTVNYNENSPQTIYSGVTYYNMTISGTGGWDKTLSGTTTITGTLNILSDTFDTGSNYTVNVGNLVINGGALHAHSSVINLTGTSGTLFAYTSGSSIATSATVNMTGNGSATVSSGGTPGFLSLASSGTGTKTMGGNVAVSSAFTVSNGTFDPSTFTMDGSSTATFTVSNATLIVPGTTLAASYPNFTSGTFGSGSIANYNRAGAQTVDNTKTYVDLTTGGSGTKTLGGTTTITGTLTVGGTSSLNTSGSNYTLNVGHIALSGGNFNPNGSLINLTGTSGSLITVSTGGQTLGTAVFNMTGNGDATLLGTGASGWGFASLVSSGTGTKTAGGSFTINSPGPLTISNGIFDPGTNTISSVGGTSPLSVTNATLNIGAATFGGNFSGFTTPTLGTNSIVDYNRAGTQTIDNTFPYFSLTVSGGGREVDVPTTGTLSVSNTFIASGSAGNILNLYSPTPGTQWTFAPAGSGTVSYVAVRDGVCSAGAAYIYKTNFTNSGNNGSCWAVETAASGSSNGGRVIVPTVYPKGMNGADLDVAFTGPSSTGVVTLSFNADPGTVSGYAISLDPNFENARVSSYVNSSTPVTFTLPNKTGTYKLYVEFIAPGGIHSSPVVRTVSFGKGSSVDSGKAAFTRTLTLGSSGADVTALQKLLASQGFLKMPQGASYGYFGPSTKSALGAFQVKHGLVTVGGPGYGLFGPKTQKAANAL